MLSAIKSLPLHPIPKGKEGSWGHPKPRLGAAVPTNPALQQGERGSWGYLVLRTPQTSLRAAAPKNPALQQMDFGGYLKNSALQRLLNSPVTQVY
jgi:hypothetical protein